MDQSKKGCGARISYVCAHTRTDVRRLCGNLLLTENVCCRVVTGVGEYVCNIQSQDSVESFIYINGDH